ncbi:MAG TPA: hypothetical protein DEU72_05800 [Desulfomicrobiaceae bacterium]|jgi:hypothetical protein|nr:hypothetical protein [Desulfomicrobiaceae bacterium]
MSRTLAILTAVAAVLLGITLWDKRPPSHVVTPDTLAVFAPADLVETAQRITLAQKNATLTLERQPERWYIVETNQTASNATVGTLLQAVKSLRGEARIGDPKDFGLTDDALRLTITTADGIRHTLRVGRMDFRVVFVARPEETQVWAVSGQLFGALGGEERATDPHFWAQVPGSSP